MDWQKYEELVKDIYQQLGKLSGVTIECWGAACKVQGKSGVKHQIDVLTSHSDGIHTYRTAIECKYWNETIDKTPVTDLATKIEDAGINKGVVVSKRGFTIDAKSMARYKNISLVEIREPMDHETQLYVEINYLQDAVYDYQAILYDKKYDDIAPANVQEYHIELQGKDPVTPCDIAEKIRKCPNMEASNVDEDGFCWNVVECDREKAYEVAFPDETAVIHPTAGYKCSIRTLKFKIKEQLITRGTHIDLEGYIAWIMEAIFEGKKFAISPDGAPTPWH